MGKVKYLFERIKNMDYKRMFRVIDELHEKTGKNKLFLFCDIVNCGIRYQAGYLDYRLFEMYDLNKEQRKTILTRGINNNIVKKYNDPEYRDIFRNKLKFNKKFAKYLNRDWMEIKPDSSNYEEFTSFTKKHKEIVVKPIDECCGKGIEILKINSKNCKEIYENLLETKRFLVEEVATQCKEIAALHPSSINTLRIVTLNHEIVAAFIRIGNNNNVVDNFNHDGLAAPINIETGIVDYKAIDKKMNIYAKHPLTNADILGFKIPKWEETKEFVKKASYESEKELYIGWDVCLSDKGPLLIEGNEFPGHDIYQLPPHRTNGMGVLPRFKKAMEKGDK